MAENNLLGQIREAFSGHSQISIQHICVNTYIYNAIYTKV